jgi:hypothetical protein
MQNVDELHVTEPARRKSNLSIIWAKHLNIKNVEAKESTSNKMSDESLIDFVTAQFN